MTTALNVSNRAADGTSGNVDSTYQEVLEIVKVKGLYLYTIPSFSAITVQFRHVLISNYDSPRAHSVPPDVPPTVDVFFCEDPGLKTVNVPTKVRVVRGCCVPKSEFSCEIDIRNMDILTTGEVFVAWRWEWNPPVLSDSEEETSDVESESTTNSNADGNETDNNCESDEESFESTQVTHTVTFKCIGVTREQQYQNILKLAKHQLGQKFDVPVRLFHEKNNPKDSRALAIQCKVEGNEWKRIGYIVKEALEETRKAICDGKIVRVRFGWIKFITDWRQSGPGFFAGINITRRGDWSPAIVRCSSHRNIC